MIASRSILSFPNRRAAPFPTFVADTYSGTAASVAIAVRSTLPATILRNHARHPVVDLGATMLPLRT